MELFVARRDDHLAQLHALPAPQVSPAQSLPHRGGEVQDWTSAPAIPANASPLPSPSGGGCSSLPSPGGRACPALRLSSPDHSRYPVPWAPIGPCTRVPPRDIDLVQSRVSTTLTTPSNVRESAPGPVKAHFRNSLQAIKTGFRARRDRLSRIFPVVNDDISATDVAEGGQVGNATPALLRLPSDRINACTRPGHPCADRRDKPGSNAPR